MKARVPERATVPRLSISSCRSMPMPVSATVSVPAAASGLMRIASCAAVREQRLVRDRLVTQLVAGIRRVGNQLPQEHVGLGIDRMHHQAQEFGHLGLKGVGLGNSLGFGAHPARSHDNDARFRI